MVNLIHSSFGKLLVVASFVSFGNFSLKYLHLAWRFLSYSILCGLRESWISSPKGKLAISSFVIGSRKLGGLLSFRFLTFVIVLELA